MNSAKMASYIFRTLEYLASPAGIRAVQNNQRRYSYQTCLLAAAQTVTHVYKYETLAEIVEGILKVQAVE